MEVNELMNLMVNNGFPVAVSAYLLIRLEKQLSSLSASINKLNTIISTKLGVVIDPDDKKDENNSGNVA
ncbi:MAG: YvrJ family protein [Clostridium sp.]|uniref:YvrJ family protein n=1 Tax=Clostridium sp. TaxID=1506 RepID=UPI00290034B6|nr:YvrJ family protein [Clostridium sp.]MDU1601570.1 YvrJ family protein [Clostridium sp.]